MKKLFTAVFVLSVSCALLISAAIFMALKIDETMDRLPVPPMSHIDIAISDARNYAPAFTAWAVDSSRHARPSRPSIAGVKDGVFGNFEESILEVLSKTAQDQREQLKRNERMWKTTWEFYSRVLDTATPY